MSYSKYICKGFQPIFITFPSSLRRQLLQHVDTRGRSDI